MHTVALELVEYIKHELVYRGEAHQGLHTMSMAVTYDVYGEWSEQRSRTLIILQLLYYNLGSRSVPRSVLVCSKRNLPFSRFDRSRWNRWNALCRNLGYIVVCHSVVELSWYAPASTITGITIFWDSPMRDMLRAENPSFKLQYLDWMWDKRHMYDVDVGKDLEGRYEQKTFIWIDDLMRKLWMIGASIGKYPVVESSSATYRWYLDTQTNWASLNVNTVDKICILAYWIFFHTS